MWMGPSNKPCVLHVFVVAEIAQIFVGHYLRQLWPDLRSLGRSSE